MGSGKRRSGLRLLLPLLAMLVVTAGTAAAERGVGVNLGRIEVRDELKPGGGYRLPELTVSNTGTEASVYGLSVTHDAADSRLRPDQAWFRFDPDVFHLAEGESRPVQIQLNLPARAAPGDYFAYVEASPMAVNGSTVGIAAATRVSFTVVPASWLDGQRHRVNRWLDQYSPWVYVLPAVLLLGLLAVNASRLPFRIRLEKK